ncbi:MAG: hypothetical protein Q4G45_00380 [Actinomycetia bacterium]|nr:hypothetical protein [Actinomycetes bacterium]
MEIDDFDIDRSTDQAWEQFRDRLSEVLSVMDDEADLHLPTLSPDDDVAPYLHFRCRRLGELLAEASSNASLGEDFQLAVSQLTTMEEFGWQPPSVSGEHPSRDFSVVWSQDDTDGLAALSIETLRSVYGVLHPVFIAPDHLAEVLAPPAPTEPGSLGGNGPGPKQAYDAEELTAVTLPDPEDLAASVAEELTEMFGHTPFRDSEGDFAIRVGSAMVFVRVTADAREVIAFSAVVHDLEGRSRAAEICNDLNAESRFIRFWVLRDRVYASMSLLAQPFVRAHLHQVVREVAKIADEIDDFLADALKGRTTFEV